MIEKGKAQLSVVEKENGVILEDEKKEKEKEEEMENQQEEAKKEEAKKEEAKKEQAKKEVLKDIKEAVESREAIEAEDVEVDSIFSRSGVYADPEEVRTGKRIFEVEDSDGKIIKLLIRRPTANETEIAEWEYSKYFNKAITQGITPEARMIEILKEQKVWTDDNEDEVNDLTGKISVLEIAIEEIDRESRDVVKLDDVREEIRKIRNDRYVKIMRRQQYLTNTAESKADEQRTRVIVSLITEYADGAKIGKRFFESYAAMMDMTNQRVVSSAIINYMTLATGLASTFIENMNIEDVEFAWESEARKSLK